MSTLQQQIDAKRQEITNKQNEVDNFDASEHVSNESYDDWLNDSYPLVNVCGYEFEPARALKELDEVAYRSGFNDYIDSLDKEQIPEYKELEEELEALQDELSDLEDELDNEGENDE